MGNVCNLMKHNKCSSAVSLTEEGVGDTNKLHLQRLIPRTLQQI